MPVLKTTCKVNWHVGNGELLFGQFIILKAKEKKGREDSGRRTGPADKSNAHNVPEKGRENSRPAHFQGQPTALIPFLLLAAGPTATCGNTFFFPFFF